MIGRWGSTPIDAIARRQHAEIGLAAGAVRYARHEAALARIRDVTGTAKRDTLLAHKSAQRAPLWRG